MEQGFVCRFKRPFLPAPVVQSLDLSALPIAGGCRKRADDASQTTDERIDVVAERGRCYDRGVLAGPSVSEYA